MGISLSPAHLKRYKDVAYLFMKYGRGDLVKANELEAEMDVQVAAEGETPVGGVFIKQRCEKTTPERAMTLETHFLRKPGQHDIDPETHEYTQGQYESWARFELLDPGYRKP